MSQRESITTLKMETTRLLESWPDEFTFWVAQGVPYNPELVYRLLKVKGVPVRILASPKHIYTATIKAQFAKGVFDQWLDNHPEVLVYHEAELQLKQISSPWHTLAPQIVLTKSGWGDTPHVYQGSIVRAAR